MQVYTLVEIKENNKKNVFEITTHHKEGAWEGSSSGEKVYKVGGYLVHTEWGTGIPIAVYNNRNEMIIAIQSRYKLQPDQVIIL